MTLNVLSVHQAASNLLDCVCGALSRVPVQVPGLMGCPCRTCVVPGAQVAWDGCDTGCGETLPLGQFPGQLSVNVVRMFQTDTTSFPRETTLVTDAACQSPLITGLELAITVLRCQPLPSDGGCPPDCDELNDAAMQQHADMAAVWTGVTCCYANTDTTRRKGRRFVLGSSRTVGPQGGCSGFEQRVTVALEGGWDTL